MTIHPSPFRTHDLPCDDPIEGVRFELRPIRDVESRDVNGCEVADVFAAWITLDNPQQLNSYTTEMVQRVILAFRRASNARDVAAVVFTGSGDRAFKARRKARMTLCTISVV